MTDAPCHSFIDREYRWTCDPNDHRRCVCGWSPPNVLTSKSEPSAYGVTIARWSAGYCTLEVDKYTVPYITLRPVERRDPPTPQNPEGDPYTMYEVCVTRAGDHAPWTSTDPMTEAEVLRWGSILATAMAVAAGRTSHGEHSRPHNPHGAEPVRADYPTLPLDSPASTDKVEMVAIEARG